MIEFWGIHNDQSSIAPIADAAVRVGWDELGDLSKLQPTRDAFKDAVGKSFPEQRASVASWAGTLYRFIHVLKVGDIIVCPDRRARTLNIGRVSGDYDFRSDAEQYRHWRPVEWIVTGVSRDDLSLPVQNELSSATTLFTISTGREEIEKFLADPPQVGEQANFDWVPFYEELADNILAFRDDRASLLGKLWKVAQTSGVEHLFKYLRTDQLTDGSRGPLRDVDPFTMFGPFNRGIKDSARARIAQAYRDEFNISAAAPTTFAGIPVVNNLNSWFIQFENERDSGRVDLLWDLAEAAVGYAASRTEETREALVAAFDATAQGNTRKLSMGLYWLRPDVFTAYDQLNAGFFSDVYPDLAQNLALRAKISGEEFLSNTEQVRSWIDDKQLPFATVPALSYAAWQRAIAPAVTDGEVDSPNEDLTQVPEFGGLQGDFYSLDSIEEDASFVPRHELETMRERLLTKKNLVLQGPPGTGKTWLARRLAWTLCNERDSRRTVVIQFHPSMAYEDFVRGYRPTAGDGGGLELADGPFLAVSDAARNDPDHRYVLVIEEVNRGNPAQIFGELLTLIEADKRNPESGMRLAYPRFEDERYHVPPNLFVIGTMNVADRSLALVDMALRRRFAFIELRPQFGSDWAQHVSGLGHDLDELEKFASRMNVLNGQIADDRSLGRQFCIGHSFVTPAAAFEGYKLDTRNWLQRVVETEIEPLLEEYWFDRLDLVEAQVKLLLES